MKAFPHVAKVHMLDGNSITKEEITSGGMDLRDYFAAKALQGYLACKAWHPDFEMAFPQDYAEKGKTADILSSVCYRMADAMMKAREA